MQTFNLRYKVTSITGIVAEHSIKVDHIGIYHSKFQDDHELIFERHGVSIPSSLTKLELADSIMGMLSKQAGVFEIKCLDIVENLSKNT